MSQTNSNFQHLHINSSASFAANSGRGALMGIADVIPGVSGGTIALVLGIYDQLILSITRFDLELLGLLKRRQFRLAASHVNAVFLTSLLAGVCAGFILMTMFIHRLLSSQPSMQLTYAVFFGLILGSIFIVYNMIDLDTKSRWLGSLVCVVAGIICSYSVINVTAVNGVPSTIEMFFCGMIAICATVLPGISGSMVLLILGVYHHFMHLPSQILDGVEVSSAISQLAVFACGATLGLVAFSRLLKYLLNTHRDKSLSVLGGIMAGALPVLWPFQKHVEKWDGPPARWELMYTPDIGGFEALVIFSTVAAAVGIILLQRLSPSRSDDEDQIDADHDTEPAE
tara:strand:+ start:2075 stop:3097 length:1023 start_codon:yes stop_codon:yes gene_type:complete